MSTAVFCIASSEAIANKIVARLKSEGFSDNDISVLFPDKSSSRDFAHEKHTKAPEGATTGAGAGGVVGGTLGLLAGIGLLAIPGIGPFIAAGPIMAALGGAGVGAAVGGITGALIGMGIPELEAKRYEGKVKDGNILISVHTDDSDEVSAAKDIFEEEDATDISTGSESSVSGSDDDADDHASDDRASHARTSHTPASSAAASNAPGSHAPAAKPGFPQGQPARTAGADDRLAR